MAKPALVLYVPAIHRSYIELFEKCRDCDLYILDEEIIADYPLAQREIRAITPSLAKRLISGLNIFNQITLADRAVLEALAKDKARQIVLSTEYIADDLRQRYFANHKVQQHDLFLRYDEKTVKAARKEIPYTGQTTQDKFHREVLARADELKGKKSTDWFLRVGAALIVHDPSIEIYGHNHWVPTVHSVWMTGDARNYLPYGSDTSLRVTLHAEQAVIAKAASQGMAVNGASIYVTSFPCPDCSNLIAEAGIKRCYFKDGYSQLSSLDVFMAHDIKLIQVV